MPLSGIRYSANDIRRVNNTHSISNESHYIGLSFKKFQLHNPAFFEIDRIYFNHEKIQFEADSVNTTSFITVENGENRPIPIPLIDNGMYADDELGFFQLREEYKGFTLFSADVIDSICEYSNFVVVSGKAIDYGQMAYQRNHTQSKYFGLKIEGDMAKLSNLSELLENVSAQKREKIEDLNTIVASGNETRLQRLVENSVENPIMDIGNDCPPKWDQVLRKVIELLKQNEISSKSLKNKSIYNDYFSLVNSAWSEFQENFIK